MNENNTTSKSQWIDSYTLADCLKQLAIAGFYLLFSFIIHYKFIVHGIDSAFCPGSGIALAVFLVGGKRYIAGILLGSLLVNTLTNNSPIWVLGATSANLFEALLGAWLLTRYNKIDLSLQRLSDYLRLIGLGGFVACFVGAAMGALTLLFTNTIIWTDYIKFMLYWWMDDVLGIVLITPFILSWWQIKWEQFTYKQLTEGLLLISITFMIGQIVFLGWWIDNSFIFAPKGFFMFLCITCIAIRFGIRTTTFALNMIAIQALSGAYLKVGYFANEISQYSLHNYWFFMLILSIVGMTLVTYVSEIKQALAALELKNSALNAAANSIVITDITGRIEWANQAFSQLTGFSLNEIIHHNHKELIKSGQHDKAYYQAMWESILTNKVWHGEFVNRRKDGSLYDEEMTITPLTDDKGKLSHFIAVKQDITERKRTETALREAHQFMYSLLNSMAEGAYGMDMDGKCTFVNQAFLRILDYKHADEFVGKSVHELIHHSYPNGKHYPVTECRIYSAYRSNQAVHATDEVFWRKNGVAVPVEYWAQPVIANGVMLGAIATFIDITERRQAENELRIAAVAFETQESMMITDANCVILRVNQAFTQTTGYTAKDAVGQTPRLLKSDRHDADFYSAMWDKIHRTGVWQGEIWDKRKNGQIYPKWLSITAVEDEKGEVSHYVGTFVDITDRKAADEEIKYLAFFDPLTDLPNRRLLLDRLEHALISSARTGRKGAMLLIDMDNFKTLNDSLGHEMGDLLLQQVALRLQACVGEGGTVARLGGDEFVVILEDLSEQTLEAATQTEVMGEKMLTDLNHSYQLLSHTYHSTPSIGATLFNNHEQPIDELLKQADIAMYQAKKQGRNALCFFDPQMQACITVRVALEADLRLALAENQFQLYYQLQTGYKSESIGAEVLLRWQHPVRGMVSPADFIPLAEETGLIIPIGKWVLDTACAQIKKWENNPSTQHLQLAVNVSARQFRQPDFVEQVRQVLNESRIKPESLKLELTESMLLDNIAEIIQKMNALQEIGVRFSLDDFGTGYSSLAYLTQLPLDQLKIDQSFVRNIGVKPTDAVIVQTIIGMANNLQIEVIAEGVETEAQRVFLELHGCELCQGYLFGKPLPIELFENLIIKKTTQDLN